MSAAPRVKICGITRLEDAEAAVGAGAAAIGFVLWPASPRAISLDSANAIARQLPPFVARVGVFVNPTPEDVERAVDMVGLEVVQLHGDEDVDLFARVPARLIKSVTAHTGEDVARALQLPPHVTPLVDAVDVVRRGGTGRAADWRGAADVARERSIILAGGLTAENVGDALKAVRPWAIDVSSGVEVSPGVKSAALISALFAALERARALQEDE